MFIIVIHVIMKTFEWHIFLRNILLYNIIQQETHHVMHAYQSFPVVFYIKHYKQQKIQKKLQNAL